VSRLLGLDFRVESPFAWHTKTDVVAKLKDAGHLDLIRHSVSCTRTRATTAEKPHCGLCSQCIDRRFAVLAAGCEAHDPVGGYGTELFTGERPETEDKTMIERWVGTADRGHPVRVRDRARAVQRSPRGDRARARGDADEAPVR
jgi:hypothetical protein